MKLRIAVVLSLCILPTTLFAKTLLISPGVLNTWRAQGGFTQTLRVGDKKYDVSVLKRVLRSLYPDTVLGTTNTFGTVTESLLKRLQIQNGIPATGVFSGATLGLVQNMLTKEVCPAGNNVTEELLHFPVSRTAPLPKEYIPSDLTLFPDTVAHVGIMCVRAPVLSALTDMFEGATKDTIYLSAFSGFRRAEIQQYLYKYNKDEDEDNLRRIAPAGYSEHQMGVALDLSGLENPTTLTSATFGTTPEGMWLYMHAWEYGFVQSFPYDKESITGYDYEPWHYRYVGKDIAKMIHDSGKTPVEILRTVWASEHVLTTQSTQKP